jgi:hypothetical protein
VPNHQFLFAVTVSNQTGFDEMLADLAGCVLNQVGYGPEAIADMIGAIRAALAQRAAEGAPECETRFLAEAGQLLIVVSYAGGREWRTARPLPSPD